LKKRATNRQKNVEEFDGSVFPKHSIVLEDDMETLRLSRENVYDLLIPPYNFTRSEAELFKDWKNTRKEMYRPGKKRKG